MTIDELCDAVEAMARRNGWELEDGKGYARWNCSSMGSRYAKLERSRIVVDSDGDDDEQRQTVKIRVSNHATAYCTEDVSLVCDSSRAGGDDHTIEQLEAILVGEFKSDF